MEPLPEFVYHPHPVETGAIEMSDATCLACERPRGFIYVGPVYAVDELQESLCPWCIADGSAAARFDAMFTDDEPVPEGVPVEIVDAVTTRTPGFSGWQQEHWLYHCGDGAAFLGAAGWPEIERHPAAVDHLRRENAGTGWSPEQIEDYLRSLDREGSPTAYLFRCRQCGMALAYSDSD
jgi:uncharacterized protein CbrC (UPF0167 family)